MNNDTRKIRAAGVEQGEIPLDRLYRLLTRGELAEPVEFYSPARGAWLPIAGIMDDISAARDERLHDLRAARVKCVRILGAGDECPACAALLEKTYTPATVPALPPAGCTCDPWCRCVIIAVDPDEEEPAETKRRRPAGSRAKKQRTGDGGHRETSPVQQSADGCLVVLLIGVFLVAAAAAAVFC
ncbi:MAG: hypothetical protein LBC18_03235 [Opitutaceae bacterium]|jgi:hypothetical protein|nr:hypothetical protein [Opitutaceae bacterium]